jgi:tetratricopeptide (TPR) repeat protein
MAVGLNGFYVQLGLMLVRNAISYPISAVGPTTVDMIVGGLAFVLSFSVLVVPARGTWQPSLAVRLAALIWLLGFVPVSRLVLPLRAVLVADRYILFASLGLALVMAVGLLAVHHRRLRAALIAAVVLGAGLRTLDARSTWRDTQTLYQRATESNPRDGAMWSAYVEALLQEKHHELAFRAMKNALTHTNEPRLLLRKALMVLDYGNRPQGVAIMQEAAEGGEPRAMANLALLLLRDGRRAEGLEWARASVRAAPMYGRGYRALGEVALAQKLPVEAMLALLRAHALSPRDLAARYLLALALLELHQPEAARPHLEACIDDPKVGTNCAEKLGQLRR